MSAGTHVVIHGRVQGVGYRAFVEHESGQLGLRGFVRNRRNGTVEALFAGPDEAISAMIERCRKGPWGASVDRIEQREANADDLALLGGADRGFVVLPTA